jgi:hypothetical protein
MAEKPILQFRRGTRFVDENGNTLLDENGLAVRDDWTTYTQMTDHINPLEGELVIEYEVVNGTGRKTPRFKLGDGVHTFAELDYWSADIFNTSDKGSIKLLSDAWQPESDPDNVALENRFYQVVTVNNARVTKNSKVDIQPTPDQLTQLSSQGASLTTLNSDGIVKVLLIGNKLDSDYELQVTVTEVK